MIIWQQSTRYLHFSIETKSLILIFLQTFFNSEIKDTSFHKMRRSQSIALKPRLTLEIPKKFRKANTSSIDIKVSPLIALESEYKPKVTPFIRVVKQRSALIKTDRKEPPKGIERVLLERYHPSYRSIGPGDGTRKGPVPIADMEIANVIVSLEERRKKFMDRYQKLFASNKDSKELREEAKIRSSLAEMRVPRSKGLNSNFYQSIQMMFEQID